MTAAELDRLLDRCEVAGKIGGETIMVIPNRDPGDESDALPEPFGPVDTAIFAISEIVDQLFEAGEDDVALALNEVCLCISMGLEVELSAAMRPLLASVGEYPE